MTKALLSVVCTTTCLILVTGLLTTAPAHAHDWYPHDCCSGQDCAPVDSVTWFIPAGGGNPKMIVTSKHGTALVPENVSPRESKDSRMHVCIPDGFGAASVFCLFVPPPS